METRTVKVPNIGCDGCVRTIKNEVSDLVGVVSVDGSADTQMVTIRWDDPATWPQIRERLVNIDYAPEGE